MMHFLIPKLIHDDGASVVNGKKPQFKTQANKQGCALNVNELSPYNFNNTWQKRTPSHVEQTSYLATLHACTQNV